VKKTLCNTLNKSDVYNYVNPAVKGQNITRSNTDEVNILKLDDCTCSIQMFSITNMKPQTLPTMAHANFTTDFFFSGNYTSRPILNLDVYTFI